MSGLRRIPGRLWALRRSGRARVGAGVALLVAAVALVALAQPWSSTRYDLNGSGVWLANDGRVGRLNTEIAEIDYVQDVAGEARVVQDGDLAYLVTPGSETSVQLLPASDPGDASDPVLVTGSVDPQAGGGRLAAIAAGRLVVLAEDGQLLDAPRSEGKVAKDSVLAVGPDGTVAAYSPGSGDLLVLPAGAEEATTDDLGEAGSDAQVSVVGGTVVVLDAAEGTLLRPDRDPVELDGADGARLQRPGPNADAVLVATDDALLSVDLGDGTIGELVDGAPGTPVAPVVATDGCTWSAWIGGADGGELQVACAGDEPLTRDLPTGEWSFEDRGRTPVLADPTDGAGYQLLQGELVPIGPWPDEEETPSTSEEQQPKPQDPFTRTPPVAVADTGEEVLGARPGTTTYLDVLRNDYDQDGDLLFVSAVEGDGVAITRGGRSLTLDWADRDPADTAALSFRYKVSDGDQESPFVEATVNPVAVGSNRPPVQVDQNLGFSVGTEREADYELLTGFWDPDGDPLFLASVTPPEGGHQVTFDSDGWVHLTASQAVGSPLLTVQVADTFGETVDGSVTVNVDAEPGEPQLRSDLAVLVVGEEATIAPLENDADPTGTALALAPEPEVVASLPANGLPVPELSADATELVVTPETVGDYVIAYRARLADGSPSKAVSTVAVRVIDPPAADAPPLAVADVVVVESSKHAEADILANDLDPNGKLLSVTDLVPPTEVDEDTLLNLRDLRVGMTSDYRTFQVDARPGARPGQFTTFTYEVSNAQSTTRTTVTVAVVAERPNQVPVPKAVPTVEVRAGDVASVAMSQLAVDPDGDALGLAVVDQPATGGRAGESGDTVRFFADDDAAGLVEVPLAITELGNPTQAPVPTSVRFEVVPAGDDSPPEPVDLVARVRTGGVVTIPVPIDGVDPDGDSVRLVGRTDVGVLNEGSVEEQLGSQAFVYTAADAEAVGTGGIDTFTYRLVDANGTESRDATITVAVTATEGNHAPVAVSDQAFVVPGGDTWNDPTANDTDLDGDGLRLDEETLKSETEGCTAEPEDGGVRVSVEDDVLECTVSYQVEDLVAGDEDGAGKARDYGLLVVQPLEGFAGVRPEANDDYPTATGSGATKVELNVVENDLDADGTKGELTVALQGDPAGVTLSKAGDLVAELTDVARHVSYTVTDGSELSAEAVVWLPRRAENRPPQLVGAKPINVKVGDEAAVSEAVGDYIVDPDGDELTFGKVSSQYLEQGPLADGLAEDRLVLKALAGEYAGPATIQLEVSDGKVSKTLVLPITIEARDNRAPTWNAGTLVVAVERGADAPATRNLRGYVDDRDTADLPNLAFALVGSPGGGLTASVSKAGELTVSADAKKLKTGAKVDVQVTVSDGKDTSDPQAITVQVTRNQSAELRALPTSVTATQGKATPVNLVPLVSNAYKGSFEVDSVKVESGAGLGTLTNTSTSFTYTPKADASGMVTVRYTVTDDLDEPGDPRTTSAVATIKVVGVPDAPTITGATATASEKVQVSWKDGDSNFEAVDEYRMTLIPATGARSTTSCSANPCTVTVRNAITYRFQVEAHNAVGWSKLSAIGGSATADTPPDATTMNTPTVSEPSTSTTSTIGFSWKAAASKGSDVLDYLVTYSNGTSETTSGLSSSIDVNNSDQQLCASVQARNDATNGGGLGPASKQVCADPYGRPLISSFSVDPGGPKTGLVSLSIDSNGGGAVAWSITGGCGNPSGIELNLVAKSYTCAKGTYALTLTVRNDRGATPSTATATANIYDTPDVLGGATMTALQDSVQIDVPGVSPADVLVTWKYSLDGGPYLDLPADGIVDADPWVSVSGEVKACFGLSCGDPIDAGSATPYGTPPPVGTPTAPRDGTDPNVINLSFSWSSPSDEYSFTYDIPALGLYDVALFDGGVTNAQYSVGTDGATFDVTVCISGTDVCSSPVLGSWEAAPPPP